MIPANAAIFESRLATLREATHTVEREVRQARQTAARLMQYDAPMTQTQIAASIAGLSVGEIAAAFDAAKAAFLAETPIPAEGE